MTSGHNHIWDSNENNDEDFNFHFDKQENNDTKQLLELCNSTEVSQSVNQHCQGHILDWVITREYPVHFICSPDVEDLQLSDHFLETVTANMSKPRLQRREVRYGNIKGIDADAYHHDFSQSLVK